MKLLLLSVAILLAGECRAQEVYEYFPEKELFSQSQVEEDFGQPSPAYEEDAVIDTESIPRTRVLFVYPRRPSGFSSVFDKFFGHFRPTFPRFPQFPLFPPSVDQDQNDTLTDEGEGSFPPWSFPSLFPSKPQDGEGNETNPLFPFDHPIFESVPDFGSLPDNYTNSTHDVHYVDGKKVIVNQTIEKSSGPNFKNFFHFKVFHTRPHGDDDATEADLSPAAEDAFPEVTLDSERSDVPIEREPLDANYDNSFVDEAENEIAIPKRLVQSSEHGAESELTRYARALSDDASQHNSLEESREYSLYPKNKSGAKYDSEEDHSGGVRVGHDLSKDTRVNSIAASGGGKQQGMSLVDPEAEIFDLGLVIKEHESHDV